MSRIEKLNGSELKRLEIMGKMKDLAIKIAEENIDSLYRDVIHKRYGYRTTTTCYARRTTIRKQNR